jgi:oxygen-independent coproporphyrinogen-3 oxidase
MNYYNILPYLKTKANKNAEITVEINPSVKKEWIDEMINLGVNRFSMGVQSFDEKKLKFLGRNHTKQKAIDTIEHLKRKEVKFTIDLIYDTKIDSKELLTKDLSYIKDFELKHISAYSLIIENKTKFAKKYNYKLNDDNMAFWLKDKLEDMGLISYEISNFATEKKYHSIHNIGYWSKKDYLGFGAGAIGNTQNKRYYNKKDIKQYIENQEINNIEIISEQDSKWESIFLGLRSIVGVDTALIINKKKLEILLQEGKIYEEKGRIYNNDFFLADEIALYLDSHI